MSDRRMRPIHVHNNTDGGYFDPRGRVLKIDKVMTDDSIETTTGSIAVGGVGGLEVSYHLKAIRIRAKDNVIALPAEWTPSRNLWTRPIHLYVTWSKYRYGLEISVERPSGAIN